MNTHRYLLDRQCRNAKRTILLGFLAFFLGGVGFSFLSYTSRMFSSFLILVALLGFAVAWWRYFRVFFFNDISCPACKGNLGIIAMMGSKGMAFWQLRFPAEYNYCPMCGVSLD